MRYASLSTLLAVLVAVCPVAAEECCQAKLKATQEKVAAALASWKEVSARLAEQCPVERAQIETEFAAAAKSCPIGSRMGPTLAFVRGALTLSIQADEACKTSCVKAGGENSAVCEQTAALMAARSSLLGDLCKLASYATGQAPACGEAAGKDTTAAAGFCPEKAAKLAAAVRGSACEKEGAEILIKGIEGLACEKKAAEIAAAVRGSACEKDAAAILIKAAGECASAAAKDGKEVAAAKSPAAAAAGAGCKETCASGGACCKDALAKACPEALAAEAKNLKASWKKAREELASFTADQRQEFAARVEKLSSRSEAFKMMPQTVQALAEGVGALAAMNGHLLEVAAANPELVKSIPEKVYKDFQAQAGLIRETSEILELAVGAAGSAGCCDKEAKAEKTVSAAR